MTFKVNGKPIGPACAGERILRTASEHLEKLPFETLITGAELASAIGISFKHFKDFSFRLGSESRERIMVDGRFVYVYGSKRTIAALRKELAK